jgi:acetate kinase
VARTILVLNAGSSSLKFALFDAAPGGRLERRAAGAFDDLGSAPHFVPRLMAWIEAQLGGEPLWAAGHRVVFGGERHRLPERVDAALLARLEALVPMMPLHLPENLSPMRRLLEAYPALPQVACFDTGFHRTLPRLARLFGLPRALADAGVLRYGFHGLSYEYVAARLPEVDARAARGRTIVAHLGNGASLCALRAGESVETTMGFSALDGLLMGTRPGALDPGVPLYLLQEKGMDPARLAKLLYHECGLLGVSGVSNDMRELLASDEAPAKEAVALFCYRLVGEIGRLAAVLGGLDALVFTGGIGEHAAPVRAQVCEALAWLGLALDGEANARHGPRLSAQDSAVSAWVIPTDEDLVIARHTRALLEGPHGQT